MAGKQAIVRVAIVADNLGLTKGLADSQSKMAKFGKTLAKGAAVAGVVAGAGLLKMAEAAAEDQKAQALLAQQLRNTAGATDEQIASVEDWITAQGKALGVADDDLRPALAKLATATGDVAEAQDLATIAMDVAAGTGKDLATVSAALAKAQNGSLGGLSKLGIATKDAAGETMTLAEVTESLRQKFSGDAATAAGTAAGQFERVKLQLSELAEDIGGAVLPTLTELGGWLIDEGVPALEDMGAAVKAELGPALADLRDWVAENHDELADFGSTVLSVVVPALETTGHIVGEAVALFAKLPGPVKETVAIAVIASLVFKNKLKPAIDQATVSTKTNVAAFQQWRAEMSYTETRAGAVATATSKLAGAAKLAAGAAGLALLSASASETNDSLAGLEQTAGTVALGFSAGGPWGAAIAYAIDSLNRLKQANDEWKGSLEAVDAARASGDINAYAESIDKARDKTDEASFHFRDLAKGGQSVQFALETARKGFNSVTGATAEANAELDAHTDRLNAWREGNVVAFNPVRDIANAIGDAAQNAIDEADALDVATESMKRHRQESLKGLNAELDYQQAIDDAAAALKENGKTVDKTTEKGRNNLRTLYDLADAWNGQDKAAKNAKGSLDRARQGFIDTATAMGMSRGEAKKLANQLFEIPEKRKTKIELEGVEQAKTNVQSLITLLSNVKDRSVNINVRYNQTGRPAESALPGAHPREQADAANEFGRTVGKQYALGVAQGAAEQAAKTPLVERLFGNAGTLDKIQAGIDAIANIVDKTVNRRIKDDKKAAAREKQILDGLRKREQALRKVGAAQDKLRDTLAQARTDLQAAKDAAIAYAGAIRDAFVSFGDITQLGRRANGRVSLPLLLRQLRQRAQDAAEFSRLIQQLSAMNLSQTQIEQLTAQGPEGALATARAIVQGGQAAVDEINGLSSQIAGSGTQLGAALNARFNQAGIDSAQAYVDELGRQQNNLNETARQMAQALVKELHKELGNVGGGGNGGGGGGGGARQGRQPNGDRQRDRTRVSVTLTAQQMSAIERGRRVQVDLDAYQAAGGRRRT